jgi:hypothetical protein
MHQPPGFVIKGSENKVLRLLKSLYGLKRSVRVWNQTFNDFLLAFDLHPTKADPCVYVFIKAPVLIITHFVDYELA